MPENLPPVGDYADEQYMAAVAAMRGFVTSVLTAARPLADLASAPLAGAVAFVGPGFSDPTLTPQLSNDPFGFLLPLGELIMFPELPPDATPKQLFDYVVLQFQAFLAAHPLAGDLFSLYGGYGMPLGPFEITPLAA